MRGFPRTLRHRSGLPPSTDAPLNAIHLGSLDAGQPLLMPVYLEELNDGKLYADSDHKNVKYCFGRLIARAAPSR